MKKGLLLLCIILCIIGCCSCDKKEEQPENLFPVYYVSKSETKIEMHPYALQEKEGKAQIEELLRAMATPAAKNEYKAPLTMGFQILDYSLQNGKLLINMDEKYKEYEIWFCELRLLVYNKEVDGKTVKINSLEWEVEFSSENTDDYRIYFDAQTGEVLDVVVGEEDY